MKCPHCSNEIGFLHLKKHFRCKNCNQKLVFVIGDISDLFMFFEIIISGALLSIFPISEKGILSWLIPVIFFVIIGFFTLIIFAHIEPEE